MNKKETEIVPDLTSLRLRLKTLEIQLLNRKKVTSFPIVQTLDDFLRESFWDQSYAGRLRQQARFLLDSNQEEFLWGYFIKKSNNFEWGHSFDLGVKARQAYHLATKILFDINCSYGLNEDQENFFKLCGQYQNFLKSNEIVDVNFLLQNFMIHFKGKKFSIMGFDFPLPLEKKIISLAEFSQPSSIRKSDYLLYTFSSFEDEIRAAYNWAKNLIAQPSDSRIAIVIDQQDLEYATIIGKHMKINFYSLAAQEKISKQSMIRLPLELLKLDHIFTWEDLSYLLCNRNLFGANKEFNYRSSLDADLRSSGTYQISLKDLSNNKKILQSCPLFIQFLKRFNQFINQRKGNKKFANWVRIINDFLQDIDWLGDRIHNSLQDKVFKSWSSVCDSLCSLDALGIGEISFHDFSYHLSRKLETIEMRYAEESSNLFILGPEQVSSVKPTHLWLIGANSGRPRFKTKISNLLPMDPQIKAMVPGIDPAVDFQLRQKLFDSFLNNKVEVIVSYSEYTKGIKNLKSPLLDRDPLIYKSCEKVKNQKTLVRPIDYENLRGAQLNHAGNSYGSVSFFADQAACPFRGYAIHRLGSKPMHEPSPGISKKLQGILVHDVLASLWGDIKSLENLRSKNLDELAGLISISIEDVFIRTKNLINCETPIIDIEKNRIKKLVLNWLEFEKKSENFKVVAMEKKVRGKIFNIDISCRLDRLDQLANGSFRVIDYKTGAFTKGDLEPPRINAPQLYLYCMLVGLDKVEGFSVAKINTNSSSIVSKILGDDDVQVWHKDLESLSQEMTDGVAARRPKNSDSTCNFCDQKVFCRVKNYENNET